MSTTLSPFADSIFRRTYALTPNETWEECAWRVADRVADTEEQRQGFFQIIRDRIFMPGGRYLYTAGRPKFMNSNCYGFMVGDNRESWAKILHDITLCLSTGGGLGINYSDLRPFGAPIRTLGGYASGPLSLMQMVNEVARHVMMGGARRSALWAGLNWNHADIDRFIAVKDWSEDVREMKARNFEYPAPLDMTNVSVIIDDEYLTRLKNNDERTWQLHYKICEHMARTGEPAFRNQARILVDDPGAVTGNACQESTLHDRDTCNLGSIVMPRIRDLGHLEHVVRLAIQFLYNGSMKGMYPTEEISDVAARNRRLGLGIMGLHEWMVTQGAGSYLWSERLERWFATWAEVAIDEGEKYAAVKGGAIPVTTRAVAPTGTISIVAETTSGIEPIYCLAPGSRVLTSGLDWVSVEDVQEGDELVGFREKPLDLRSNKFEPSVVVSKAIIRRPVYRITTDRGAVTASSEHLWVARPQLVGKQTSKGQGYDWVPSEHLSPGMQIAFTIEPWRRDETFDGGWVSGMFDSEGHSRGSEYRRGLRLTVAQKPGAMLDRLKLRLAENGIEYVSRVMQPSGVVQVEPAGKWMKLKALGVFRPGRLLANAGAAFHDLKLCGKYSPPATVLSVEYLGEQEVIALGTSTRTLIAEGFLSHNCVAYKRRYMKSNQHFFQYVVDPTAKRLLDAGVNAEDIEDAYSLSADFERRIAVQARVQDFVDQAISSTVNLPTWGSMGNDAPGKLAEVVAQYLPMLKGLTFYPNGARHGQPLVPVDLSAAKNQEGVVYQEDSERCANGVCGL